MLVGESATATVAFEDLALDVVGDMTRRGRVRLSDRSLLPTAAHREALLLHPFDQYVQCFLEESRHVSVWDPVAQEILSLAKLVMARATRSELELERLFGQRRNLCAPRYQCEWSCERRSMRRVRWRQR